VYHIDANGGAVFMECKLTMQEKLNDLRKERKLKYAELEKATGISVSTLQRMENDAEVGINYQDIVTIAKFYDVSADYLLGFTDNRKYRNVAIGELGLTDDAIETLKSRKLNNRLVSEILSHPDAKALFSAMEVYIDRKIHSQINTMNTIYTAAEEIIRENYDVSDGDEYVDALHEAVVDEDEYLRYRITERFSALMKSLFDMHKKDALPDEQMGILEEMKTGFKTYLTDKEKQGTERAKLILFAKQIGLNISKLTDEQISLLMETLRESETYKKGRRRK